MTNIQKSPDDGKRPQGSSRERLSRLWPNALIFTGKEMKTKDGIHGRSLPFPQAPRAGYRQRPDTGWASPVPVLWTAGAGSGRPRTAPAELRRTEDPARPGLPQDRPPPNPGVGKPRCLLLPRRDWAGGPSASRETAADRGAAYGAAAAAVPALTERAAGGPRPEPCPAQPSPARGARPPSETPLEARGVAPPPTRETSALAVAPPAPVGFRFRDARGPAAPLRWLVRTSHPHPARHTRE
ncbi:uncharacterized protein LOC116445465 [Corvus moneduloides]|uniref:uncharacterized protein LOC116445465 n=1 Tax=Corvus moneduloides TaxID=1196302 RepID=UPI001363B5BF|nr:uncharacterized protein LOC116445465 [Corvus moneduloides]